MKPCNDVECDTVDQVMHDAGVFVSAISSRWSIRRSDISLKVPIKLRKYLTDKTASAEVHFYLISLYQRCS